MIKSIIFVKIGCISYILNTIDIAKQNKPIAFRNTLYIANSLYINTMFANSFYARNLIRGLITHLCS